MGISISHDPLRVQIRAFLAKLGLRVRDSECPDSQAVDVPEPVDLLITDARFETGTAPAIQAALGPSGPSVLVISSDPEYINRALFPDLGVDFIEKPFAWRDLGERIGRLLERRPRVQAMRP